MTRYIDADNSSKEMYEEAFEKDSDLQRWDSGCWIRYKLFENVLDAQPSVDAVPQWILCSERLPEIKGHYVSETCLVCLDNGTIGFSELLENIFGQVGWSCEREDDYHEPLGDVIAWMPLPKPYEVKND